MENHEYCVEYLEKTSYCVITNSFVDSSFIVPDVAVNLHIEIYRNWITGVYLNRIEIPKTTEWWYADDVTRKIFVLVL